MAHYADTMAIEALEPLVPENPEQLGQIYDFEAYKTAQLRIATAKLALQPLEKQDLRDIFEHQVEIGHY